MANFVYPRDAERRRLTFQFHPARAQAAGVAASSDDERSVPSAAIWAIAFVVAAMVAVNFQMEGALIANVRSYAWRVGSLIFAATLLATAKFSLRTSREFLFIFAPWLASITLLVIIQLGEFARVEDLSRQLYMISIGGCVYVGAQNPVGRTLIRRTMTLLLVYLILASIAPAKELMSGGWNWEKARVFKNTAAHNGTNLNTNFFAIALLVMGLWSDRRRLLPVWAAGGLTLLAGSVFFAVRAPLVSAAIASILAAGYVALQTARGPSGPPRWAPLAIIVVPVAATILIATDPPEFVTELLAMRTYLWEMAVRVWQAHPLVGGGENPLLVGKGIALNAPAYRVEWERSAIVNILYGGFHNQWLEVLASKGLVGFVGLFGSFFLLLRRAMMSAVATGVASMLTLVLLMLMRSFVELQAPFSYQNSALDFLAMSLLAACAAQARNPAHAFAVQGGGVARRIAETRSGAGAGRRV